MDQPAVTMKRMVLGIPLVRVATRGMHTSLLTELRLVAMTLHTCVKLSDNCDDEAHDVGKDLGTLVHVNAVAGRRPVSHLDTSNKIKSQSVIPPT